MSSNILEFLITKKQTKKKKSMLIVYNWQRETDSFL